MSQTTANKRTTKLQQIKYVRTITSPLVSIYWP